MSASAVESITCRHSSEPLRVSRPSTVNAEVSVRSWYCAQKPNLLAAAGLALTYSLAAASRASGVMASTSLSRFARPFGVSLSPASDRRSSTTSARATPSRLPASLSSCATQRSRSLTTSRTWISTADCP